MVGSGLLICNANGQRGGRLCFQCQRTNWVKGVQSLLLPLLVISLFFPLFIIARVKKETTC